MSSIQNFIHVKQDHQNIVIKIRFTYISIRPLDINPLDSYNEFYHYKYKKTTMSCVKYIHIQQETFQGIPLRATCAMHR